ncbi:MerR family transcriptional regulator [Amycolatopsis sp. NPDC049868]|uniref:MerR family transcriptional regulator n=1 Tax=Amycolatopsis sp. NPDC049868 TaxID=3363934 RepID=UPI0037ACE3F3
MTELAIGQVTERTGLSVHALRFYEKEGLLAAPVKRDANGRRVYTENDVEWLLNCTKFRASGMPLAVIREFAALVRQGPGNEEKRLELLREHQNTVRDRIAELADCLELISRKVEVYEEHVARGTANELWR